MSGSIVILGGRLIVKSIDLVVLFVVARLLTQAAFGLIGLAMTFVVVLEAVLDIALIQALLKEKRITRPMLDTVFTLSVIRGLLLAFILGSLAFPIAWLYQEPRLAMLISVLSLAPAMRGARSPALVFYIKELDFSKEILIELTGKFIGGMACIATAWFTQSYWALVVGVVLPPTLMNVFSYVVAPYRPRLTLSKWHRFSSYTGWMTVSQITRAIGWQIDKILLGSFLLPTAFGRYSVAKDLSNTSQNAILPSLLKPLVSACSKHHHASADLGKFFIKSCNAVLLIVGPIFLGLGLCAEHVVLLGLGPQWSESASILRWLSFTAILGAVYRPVDSLALVLERNRDVAMRGMILIAIRLPLVMLGCLLYSWQGAVLALFFSEAISCCLMIHLGCQFTGAHFSDALAAFRNPIAGLALMAASLLWLLPEATLDAGSLTLAVRVLLACVLSAGVYSATVLGGWWMEGAPSGLEKAIMGRLAALIKPRLKWVRQP